MTQSRTRKSSLAKVRRRSLCTAVTCALLLAVAGQAAAQAAETGEVGNPDSWKTEEFAADWGLEVINAHHAYARGLSGKGVMVGLFDSGTSLKHQEFAGKDQRAFHIADILADGSACTNTTGLLDSDCFSSNGDQPSVSYFHYTDEDRALTELLVQIGAFQDWVPDYLESLAGFSYDGHGSHVAGTMVANRDGSGTHGVAFASDIAAVRMFANSYSDFDSLVFGDGVNLSIGPDSSAFASMYRQMHDAGVKLINHSWGLASEPATVEDMDALYAQEGVAEYLSTFSDPSLENGLLQVWAAGNDHPIAGLYASLPRWVDGLEPYWLSVVNINRDGELSDSSAACAHSMDWCITAPGTDITSTVPVGTPEGEVVYDADGNPIGLDVHGIAEDGYADYTGTSMAAPHVTGALALLMERFPYLDNPQIRDVLLTTATDLGEEGVDEVFGWGLVDLQKAIEGYGQLRVDTDVVMNQRAGGAKVWDGMAWDDWTNDIGGPGRLSKSGIGWLRLSGDNSFAGLTLKEGVLELAGANNLSSDARIDGGILQLTGSLNGSDLTINGGVANIAGQLNDGDLVLNNGVASISGLLDNGDLTINAGMATVNGRVENGNTLVASNGLLGGTGTLANTRVEGSIAPGNSIGTLNINGDYIQAAGSHYLLELAPPSQSDLLSVSGTATLEGGTVQLLRSPGSYLLGQTYNILSAEGGINGEFAGLDTGGWVLPFLDFGLHYGNAAVTLDVVRGAAFVSVADSVNQRAVAAALDTSIDSNILVQEAVLLDTAEQARAAIDQLSGDIYPGLRSALVDSSRMPRQAALDRARAASDGFAGQSYQDAPQGGWVEVYGSSGHTDGDGNAARINQNSNAVLAGYDYQFSHWRIGGFIGNGRTDFRAVGRNADGHANNDHYSIYAAGSWGGFGLRAAYLDAEHDIRVERNIAFAGFDDQTHARFDGNTRQAVIEAGYRFDGGRWEAEPFLQYADLRMSHDAFDEAGGAAALSGNDADSKLGISTAGARFAVNLGGSRQQQSWLSLRGMVGYRKFDNDDDVPQTTLAWADGPAFVVSGASLSDDASVAELSVAARVSPHGLLEFGYSGQFADDGKDDGVNLRYSLQF